MRVVTVAGRGGGEQNKTPKKGWLAKDFPFEMVHFREHVDWISTAAFFKRKYTVYILSSLSNLSYLSFAVIIHGLCLIAMLVYWSVAVNGKGRSIISMKHHLVYLFCTNIHRFRRSIFKIMGMLYHKIWVEFLRNELDTNSDFHCSIRNNIPCPEPSSGRNPSRARHTSDKY